MIWRQNYDAEAGWLYPRQDRDTFTLRKIERSSVDIDLAVSFCKQRRSVVQAGGHVGVWPAKLARLFEAVYTFEPDGLNFVALVENTGGLENVFRFQAALGDKHELVGFDRTGKNSGAHYVNGRGRVPALMIDDLALDDCDLIYLDIEGAESMALRGAAKTIEKSGPVVAFEDKGHGERFGVATGELERFMRASFGYRVAAHGKNDIVMVKE